MRLKTFFAPTVQEAMTQVRHDLGSDAVIISTIQEKTGVRVTAALEHRAPKVAGQGAPSKDELFEHLTRCVTFHGVPSPLKERLLSMAEETPAVHLEDAATLWAPWFAQGTRVSQIVTNFETKTILLVGTPGAGKSVTLAKLAVEALLEGRKVRIVTLDEGKAGAIEQLSTYGSHLKVDVASCVAAKDLTAHMKRLDGGELLLIDTPGINPFSRQDVEFVSECVFTTQCVPHWVFSAGCDVWEALEMAEIFKDLGVREIIHTKGDVARRHGALLSVLTQEPMHLVGLSQGPTLSQRLEDATAETLHDLLKSTFFVQSTRPKEKAVSQIKQLEKTKEVREPIWIARLKEARA